MVVIKYTKEEIQDLIVHLKGYGSTYEVLADFFERLYLCGILDFGLCVPGTQGSSVAVEFIKKIFPDVWYALSMPVEDLPLFISNKSESMQEYPVACWRLKLGK